MSKMISSRDGVKARKTHRCCLCGEYINLGDTYDKRTGVGDGWWTMYMHPECHALEQVHGRVDPDWYEDISDSAFERPTWDQVRAAQPVPRRTGSEAVS